MRRVRLVLLLAGTMLLAAGVVAGSVAQHSRSSRDHTLTAEAATRAAIVQDYFDRARDIVLLTAQDPAFAQFYPTTTRRETAPSRRQLMSEINDALAYLQVLYKGSIGEACFIDGGGAENARVVGSHVAAAHDLSPDESGNPFFKPTLALQVGQAYQATPYVSPDTGEWVISNSTRIPRLARGNAILHFEVTVESMRRAMLPTDPRLDVRIHRPGGHRLAGTAADRGPARRARRPVRSAPAGRNR
jgi:hypothetical protein